MVGVVASGLCDLLTPSRTPTPAFSLKGKYGDGGFKNSGGKGEDKAADNKGEADKATDNKGEADKATGDNKPEVEVAEETDAASLST